MFVARIDTDTAVPLAGGLPTPPAISFAMLAEQVQNRMGGLEDTFRETGETLATAIGTIDGMADGLATIRQALSHDTAGVAVSRLRDVAYRLITLPIIQKRRAIEVETLTGRTRELRGLLNEVSTILKLLGIYGMNIKIASSGEAAFFNFVVGMDEKLTTGRQELRQIERQLDQFGRVVGDVQQADRLLATECDRAGAAVPAELTANANALQDHIEAVMRMTEEVGGIVRTVQGEVARILGAIQIGDSVRQRAEHAIAMLRRVAMDDAQGGMPEGAKAHMARLISAQLNAMADEFGREIASIVTSLERLAPLADHLRELLGSQGGADGQLLFRLEHGISSLGNVTDQLCDADGHLAELTGFVSRTLADLTDGLSRIRHIAVNVQDISTNTQLLCRRHGTLGRAVAVIAKEVAPCASRLDQLSVAVGSLIGVLSGIDLVQQDNTHSENGDTRGALQEALSVVRRACESSAGAMVKGGGDAERIVASLQASAGDLGEQHDFVQTLCTVALELTRYADRVAPETPNGTEMTAADEAVLADMLPWAASLYTMASERLIHAAYLLPGMEPVATVTAAVTFDDDDDGLF
jgi:phage host-nuclease inhibitor protein Gam